MTSLTSAVFAPPGAAQGVSIPVGSIVPLGFNPVDKTLTVVYDTASKPGVRILAAVTAPLPKTPSPSSPSATLSEVAAPPVAAATYAISKGGFYIAVPSGARFFLAAGLPVPTGWTPEVGTTPPTPPIPVADIPAAAAEVVAEAYPNAVGTGPSIPTILKIIGVLGAGGLAYLGYLAVTNPEGARYFLSRFTELKDLVVDSSQLLVALGVIGAIGFVSYEFIGAYESEGSVAGALGKLTASTIETMVLAIVDAIEQLVKDAANWVVDKIDSLLP